VREYKITNKYFQELDIEKQKSNNLLRKYEQDSGHSTQQLRHELISTEKVTIEQRQYYEKQIEQLQRDKNDLKKELDTLRDVLKELHEQTSKKIGFRRLFFFQVCILSDNQGAMNNDRINNLQLKEDLLAKETNLFQAQSTITDLKKELEQAKEEVIQYLFFCRRNLYFSYVDDNLTRNCA
jgi:Fic family protein